MCGDQSAEIIPRHCGNSAGLRVALHHGERPMVPPVGSGLCYADPVPIIGELRGYRWHDLGVRQDDSIPALMRDRENSLAAKRNPTSDQERSSPREAPQAPREGESRLRPTAREIDAAASRDVGGPD